MRDAVLIYNPAAGTLVRQGPDFIPNLSQTLEGYGLKLQLEETSLERSATMIALEHANVATPPMIIAAGGDGTVADTARSLVGTQATLGVIPLGTFNNVARSLGIPFEHEAACELLGRSGVESKIDVGRVNGKHIFFEAAGVGLDAALFPLAEDIKSGDWTRYIQAAGIFSKFSPFKAKITLDHRHTGRHGRHKFHAHSWMILCANAPFYGPACEVSPKSTLDDGLLRVHLFSRPNRASLFLNMLARIGGGKRVRLISNEFPVRTIKIEGSKAQPVHLDGNTLNEWPVFVEVLPGALQVMRAAKTQDRAET